jgi:hypothetical protein
MRRAIMLSVWDYKEVNKFEQAFGSKYIELKKMERASYSYRKLRDRAQGLSPR